jgi:hypothetical protein
MAHKSYDSMEEVMKRVGNSRFDHNGQSYPSVDNVCSISTDNYHSGDLSPKFRRKKMEDGADKIFFGYEAEKVDDVATLSISLDGVKAKLKKRMFRIEKDSSLGATHSYELISPVYSLSSLWAFLEDSTQPEIKRLLDAGFTSKCGGHITLSSAQEDVSGAELAEMIFPYMPLLYALYPDRTSNSYCRAKVKYHFVVNPEKYSALYVKGRLCEIRLFPAIKNTANLYWRVRLLKAMLVQQAGFNELQVMESLVNKNSFLYKILREVYSEEKIGVKANQYMVLCRKYNNVVFSPSQVEKFRAKIQSNVCPSIEMEVTDALA